MCHYRFAALEGLDLKALIQQEKLFFYSEFNDVALVSDDLNFLIIIKLQ